LPYLCTPNRGGLIALFPLQKSDEKASKIPKVPQKIRKSPPKILFTFHLSLFTLKNPILIADSGSTKTDWLLALPDAAPHRLTSQGLNPYQLSAEQIASAVRTDIRPAIEASFKKELSTVNCQLSTEKNGLYIFFYGAGCRAEGADAVRQALAAALPEATEIQVESDLLGAARALCRDEEGIACILGTGSNSAHFDGRRIVRNVSPLGFILGDEGSGAVLGRRLVGDVLKRQLSADVCEMFEASFPTARPTKSSAAPTASHRPTAFSPPSPPSLAATASTPKSKPSFATNSAASSFATCSNTAAPTSPSIS